MFGKECCVMSERKRVSTSSITRHHVILDVIKINYLGTTVGALIKAPSKNNLDAARAPSLERKKLLRSLRGASFREALSN